MRGLAMAVAGLFGAAERQVSFRADSWRIHVDDAGCNVAHGSEGIVYVARVDGGRQSVLHPVGNFDGLSNPSTPASLNTTGPKISSWQMRIWDRNRRKSSARGTNPCRIAGFIEPVAAC